MSDAVRGDFERLRARRQREKRGGERPPAARPERIVLTPPPRPGVEEPAPQAEEHVTSMESSAPAQTPAQEPEERRSWLRSLLHRG